MRQDACPECDRCTHMLTACRFKYFADCVHLTDLKTKHRCETCTQPCYSCEHDRRKHKTEVILRQKIKALEYEIEGLELELHSQ